MSTAICFRNETQHADVAEERNINSVHADSQEREGASMWTTRQVIAACLWSALIGLLCGYAWLFFHFSQAGM